MRKILLLTIVLLLSLIPAIAFAGDPVNSVPKPSEKLDHSRNTSNPASHYFGIDSQGNTLVLTPNHSGGYIGFDSQGKALTITPLRGPLGVDSKGNIWTITSR